jgi:hypothetical protein
MFRLLRPQHAIDETLSLPDGGVTFLIRSR